MAALLDFSKRRPTYEALAEQIIQKTLYDFCNEKTVPESYKTGATRFVHYLLEGKLPDNYEHLR